MTASPIGEGASSVWAQGGIVGRPPGDTPEALAADIEKAGDGLCFPDAVALLAREGPEAALHPVADDGIADLLGDGESDAHGRIRIVTRADEKDEAGHGCALAAIGGEEVRALADDD